MELRGRGLDLSIRPVDVVDPRESEQVDISIRVAGFRGHYQVSSVVSELLSFDGELGALMRNLIPGRKAVLDFMESVRVELIMGELGHIEGRYEFTTDSCGVGGMVPTMLTGAFTLDQSYLPALRREVVELLADLGVGRSD